MKAMLASIHSLPEGCHMRRRILRLSVLACLVVGVAGRAQAADVCVTIDTAHDTFSASDQAGALILISRQFEAEGERVVAAACTKSYSVSHVRLGNTIVVTISGPDSRREAIAQGTDDLPALYSQMVRSIVTGRPMTGLNVVDRTNVTESQASAQRVHTDSLWYARLGYGALFGDSAYGTPALGFGYRAEFDRFGIDVAFLNFQFPMDDSYTSANASAQSILKLSGLFFLNPTANRTTYLGGGLSYGHQSFGGAYDPSATVFSTGWDGSGLQGELTAGYELARATTLRVFVQADVIVPFYQATAETFSRTGFTVATTSRRHAPSLVVAIGLGR
jgi:hypothetical protein